MKFIKIKFDGSDTVIIPINEIDSVSFKSRLEEWVLSILVNGTPHSMNYKSEQEARAAFKSIEDSINDN